MGSRSRGETPSAAVAIEHECTLVTHPDGDRFPVSRESPLGAVLLRRPSQLEGGIAEEVVDRDELGESAGGGVAALGGEDGVPEPFVPLLKESFEQELVHPMGGSVEAQTAGREGGDGATGFGFQQRFGERVEIGEMEVAVEAVHGEKQGLLGLVRELGDVGGVEDVLVGPEVDSVVTDVAPGRRRRARELRRAPMGPSRRRESSRSESRARGGKSSDGEVGEEVVAVDGGESRVRRGPEIGGPQKERGNLIPNSGLQVVLEIVGGVAEQEHVAHAGARASGGRRRRGRSRTYATARRPPGAGGLVSSATLTPSLLARAPRNCLCQCGREI
jgi:hypothetical protein